MTHYGKRIPTTVLYTKKQLYDITTAFLNCIFHFGRDPTAIKLIMPPLPLPPPLWPMPKFKFTIEDLDHEGADIFLTAVQPKVALREAAIASFKQLYTPETAPTQLVFDHHLIPNLKL
jgi:hypothetical protein